MCLFVAAWIDSQKYYCYIYKTLHLLISKK